MKNHIRFILLMAFLSMPASELYSQFKMSFGDFSTEELSNKPYKKDPGADAIILSDIGVATLNYNNGWYIELERDVRIRIVNSNGFDYANIEIPYSSDDRVISYRASSFNTKDGEKTETKIPKKSFITEKTSNSEYSLKFNFPDVHESTIIEYSYILRMTDNSIFSLVPWEFQTDIPVILSSLTIEYPEAFVYNSIISGSANDVRTGSSKRVSSYMGERTNFITRIWETEHLPAFRVEPFIKSKKEHLTKLSFELTRIDFPGSVYKEITPTYESLTSKLLERVDFGKAALTNLKSVTEQITAGQSTDIEKLISIHRYISTNILWDGMADFTASTNLKSILRKEKGNSADINLLLIAMLRSVNIKAEPVILSTRSNGSLNKLSAMLQQFNYVVASVSLINESYLVDATDPLRPFNLLPFDCLNGYGRLISAYRSDFVELKNAERKAAQNKVNLVLDANGNIQGTIENRYSDFSAYNIRKRIRLEGEDGYLDNLKTTNTGLSDFRFENINDIYSELIEKCSVKIPNAAQIAGNEIIFTPSFLTAGAKNPLISEIRIYPVDFGCPDAQSYSLTLVIPEGFSLISKPADITYKLGTNDGIFEFSCNQKGSEIVVTSVFKMNKTIFQPSEYLSLRDFYSKILQKQSELIVLKKNI